MDIEHKVKHDIEDDQDGLEHQETDPRENQGFSEKFSNTYSNQENPDDFRESSYSGSHFDERPLRNQFNSKNENKEGFSVEVQEDYFASKQKILHSAKPPLSGHSNASSKGKMKGDSDTSYDIISKAKEAKDQIENSDPNIDIIPENEKPFSEDDRPIKPAKMSFEEEDLLKNDDSILEEAKNDRYRKESTSSIDDRPLKPLKKSFDETHEDEIPKQQNIKYDSNSKTSSNRDSEDKYDRYIPRSERNKMKQSLEKKAPKEDESSKINIEDERPISSQSKKNTFEENEIPISSSKSNPSKEDERPLASGKYNIPEDTITPEEITKKIIPKKTVNSKTKAAPKFELEEEPIKNFNDERPLTSGKIDELPVGGGSKFNISEYPEGMDPEQMMAPNEGQETGPLNSRLTSRLLKTRQNAFIELTQLFKDSDGSDPVFSEYASELSKFIAESNPGAQEKALEALKGYLTKSSRFELDTCTSVKVLIDKALGPGKVNIKKISLEILKLIFKRGEKNQILDGIIESINHKNQKTAVGGVQAVVELLSTYGPKKLDYLKPFAPHIEKLAASTTSTLRTEAMNFYKEAYKYMGEAMKIYISKLKKVQIEELEKNFQEIGNILTLAPEDDTAGTESTKTSATGGLDAYDISDPVDIFHKYNEAWTEKVLSAPKWNEKRDMIEEFLTAANVPKISNSPVQHITSMVKKLLADNNSTVNNMAIKIFTTLSKGMRKNFSSACKIIMPFLLPKLKDKKTVDETCKCLDSFFYCITPDDVIEDLKEALGDKLATYKIQVMAWIERYFEKCVNTPEKTQNLFKNVIVIYKKLLDDGASEVRDFVVKTLGKMKKILGENYTNSFFSDINSAKMGKINEALSNIQDTTANTSNGFKPPKKKMSLDASTIEEEKIEVSKPQTAKGSDSKKIAFGNEKSLPPAKGSAAQNSGTLKKNNSQKSLAVSSEDSGTSSNLTNEEVDAKIAELDLPASILTGLDDSQAKEKARGLNELQTWINENTSIANGCLEHITKFLRNKMKDWKESNLIVVKEIFQFFIYISQNPSLSLNKRCFSLVSPFLVNNIGEAKYVENCTTIILSFVEFVPPKSVFLSMISVSQDPKNPKSSNPKTIIEISNLFSKLIEQVTVKHIPLKETIDFGKFGLANPNSNVRTASTNLFKSIYQQLGAPLNDFLNDVNPQTLKTLQAEFANITPMTKIECKINFRGDAQAEAKESTGSALDSLPRADISKEAEKITKKLNDKDWRVKNEGLEALDALLTSSNNRILPGGLNDLVTALKVRLNDNNKSQVKAFIALIGRFATALGPAAKNFSKTLIPEIAKNLSDKQNVIRNESLQTLDKFSAEIGTEGILNILLPSLIQDNPELRTEILQWILKNQDGLAKTELKQQVGVILTVLQDKTKEIRNLSEKLLEKSISIIGAGPYLLALKDLKPAIQQSLLPIISKYQTEEGKMDVEHDPNNTSFDKKMGRRNSSDGSAPKNLSKDTQGTASTNQLKTVKNANPLSASTNLPSGSLNNSSTAISVESRPGTAQNSKPQKSPLTQQTIPSNILVKPPTGNIFYLLGQKLMRLEEEKTMKWAQDELRDDLIERLKNHLRLNMDGDLVNLMFSIESKKVVEAIKTLKKALVSELQGTVDILDLLLRWIFVRNFENSNQSILKESLDYLNALFGALESGKYVMSDFEVEELIICLVSRVGETQFFGILKAFARLCSIYNSTKIFNGLLQGMNSFQYQVRLGCIDMLTALIKLRGPQVLTQRDFRVFFRLLCHPDQKIKIASLNLITISYSQLGDEFLNSHKAEISSSDLELLSHNLSIYQENKGAFDRKEDQDNESLYHPQNLDKIIPKDAKPKKNFHDGSLASRIQEINNSPTPAEGKSISKTQEQNNPFVSQAPIHGHTSHQAPQITSQPSFNIENTKQISGQKIDEETFDKHLGFLVKGIISSKLDALLYIHEVATSETDEAKNLMKIKADELLLSLQTVLRLVFESSRTEIPSKFVFYFLNMTHKLCSVRSLLKYVKEENLRAFSEEMLNRLLAEDEEKTFENAGETESLVKTLNSTMLRILENSNPNDMLSVLFDLLIKNRRVHTYAKVLGLIIKCILKLTKALEQLVEVIQPEKILLKSHLYLSEFAPDSKGATDDIGIKTIKTILNELVKLYGEKIVDYYNRSVKDHPQTDNCLHRWISVILHPMNPSQPNYVSPRFPSALNKDEKKINQMNLNVLGSSTSGQVEIQELYQLIEKIQSPENFEQGIKQIYDILIQNPGQNIQLYLKNVNKNFADQVLIAIHRQANNTKSQNLDSSMNEGSNIRHQRLGTNQIPQIQTQSNLNTSYDQIESRGNQSGFNIQDHHNRLNSVRMRYGEISNNEATRNNFGSNQQSHVLYTTSEPESVSVQRRNSSNGPSQTRSTENILQKLSEMKARMANIVNPNNRPGPN